MKNLKNQIAEIVDLQNEDVIKENANTDGTSPMGTMGLLASLVAKEYAKEMLEPKVLKKFEEGYIHIHDFDYYLTGTTTCCQIPLGKKLEEGFKVGECFMRTPKSITTAMSLAAILVQSNQNQQHGGQSFPNFDYDLAPYVKASYKKNLKTVNDEKQAWNLTMVETRQAAEGFVHNCNSMLSRNGMQVPFVSINFGLDTSREGRLISSSILSAQESGIGNGDTPLFPILVLKLKQGINMNEGEPNYDIYRQALECLSKRLFPNFQFVDTDFNLEGFDINRPETHIATMGCRTRVFTDIFGENTTIGRGNLSFTTINLPMIAKESLDKKIDFMILLDEYIDLVTDQLLTRLKYQKSRLKSSFKVLYEGGVWNGSENYMEEEIVGDVLNTGTLSLGFIGLAESLVLLKGKHHGEDEGSQRLGLDIIKHMRIRMDEESIKKQLNFSLLATPAESYSGTSVRKFVEKYGVIDRVSDKDFFTNSSHVPVYHDISIKRKIEIEAPYHAYENAGHILYVELDGEAAKNIESLDDVVKLMAKNQVGYGSINHPVDRCRSCGNSEIIVDNCRICGSDDISRIRRITGYLVGDMDKWNNAKKDEESKRVKHGKN